MIQHDRRNRQRRVSDDCSQCGIYENQISTLKEDIDRHQREAGDSIMIIHRRIDKALPWKVFLLVMAAYLGLAGYNAVAIKALSIDMAKVQTKMESVEKTMNRVGKAIGQ
jgi:hypothetical protein